jgi:hypothetical protein
MNTTRLSIAFLLAAIVAVVLATGAALTGCATGGTLHGSVPIDAPTALVTGPAHGHWAEENDRNVIAYTVLGTDCTSLSAQDQAPRVSTHGRFLLAPGVTLCVLPVGSKSRNVLFHAERP